MKRRYKIMLWAAGTLGVAVIGLRLVLSHDSPCGVAPPLAAGETPMKGWVHRCYGGPDIVQYEELPKPQAADDEVIVKVRAASVNPLDWHYMRGKPYVMRMMGSGIGAPKDPLLGVDFAGVVESVGKSVTKFKPGDEVFGGRDGAFSEYVRVRESRNIVMKPANISFEEAAAVPIAAITALQAVRDHGKLKAGEKMLVNGASGGVGTFAVQIAKAMGAEVTGVCSGRNVELVRSLGADHVIDYTHEDFVAGGPRFDLMLDTVGNRSLSDCRSVLVPEGAYVSCSGGNSGAAWLFRIAALSLASLLTRQKLKTLFTTPNHDDLLFLKELVEAGKAKPVIERRYALSEVADALRHVGEGHARGQTVIRIAA